jgi:hypothetical protein
MSRHAPDWASDAAALADPVFDAASAPSPSLPPLATSVARGARLCWVLGDHRRLISLCTAYPLRRSMSSTRPSFSTWGGLRCLPTRTARTNHGLSTCTRSTSRAGRRSLRDPCWSQRASCAPPCRPPPHHPRRCRPGRRWRRCQPTDQYLRLLRCVTPCSSITATFGLTGSVVRRRGAASCRAPSGSATSGSSARGRLAPSSPSRQLRWTAPTVAERCG